MNTNIKQYKIFYLLVLIIIVKVSSSQENIGGVPLVYQYSQISETVETLSSPVNLPFINNNNEIERAQDIINENCQDCKNNYYGTGIDVSIDIKNLGTEVELENLGKVWLLKIESITAYGLQFYFDSFKIPEGARLYIYNEDLNMNLGGYTHLNNGEDEDQIIKFGTQFIKGESVILEYFEPYQPEFSGSISLKKVIHIFRNVFEPGLSGECQTNASCFFNTGIDNEISSVGIILAYNEDAELMGWCSGSLINNTAEDGTPYFLSANHCIDNNGVPNPLYDYSTWLFLFNYQTPNCLGNSENYLGFMHNSVFGSTLISSDEAGSPNSDFLLLQLSTTKDILADWGLCYAGWSIADYPDGPCTAIHHPSGDVKKISFSDESSPISTFYGNTNEDFLGNFWKVMWANNGENGTTEGGSSGSPLFDNNNKIIGALFGGTSACDEYYIGQTLFAPYLPDWYGKFSVSWEIGGFQYYLDPINTGQTEISSFCPENESTGGGSGGSGGGSSNCTISDLVFGDFLINGSIDNVVNVCKDEPIILRRYQEDPDCPQTGWFIPNSLQKSAGRFSDKCQEFEEDDPIHCYDYWFSCICNYKTLFISVALCNSNLEIIGTEYSKWQHFTYPDVVELSGGVYMIKPFDLREFLPSDYIHFESDQYYKIKLARISIGGYGEWVEESRYFKIVDYRSEIDNETIENNVYGDIISISNSTVDSPLTISATNSIKVLPNSILKYGKINAIEELNINCEDLVIKNEFNSLSYNNFSDNSFYQKDANIVLEYNNSLKIFPNPAKNQIQFQFEVTSIASSYLIIRDVYGKAVITESNYQSGKTLNISNLNNGIYIAKVVLDGRVYQEKFVVL